MNGCCRTLYLPFFFLWAIAWAGAAFSQQSDGTESLRIAACRDCMPFSFIDESGRPAGSIIDIWRLWSAKTGRPVVFDLAALDDTVAMVDDGRADIHAGLFSTTEWQRSLIFGGVVLPVDTHLFLHQHLPPLSDLDQVGAYRVGVPRGDPVGDWLASRIGAQALVRFQSYTEMIEAASAGRIKVLAAGTPTALHHLRAAELASMFVVRPNQRLYAKDLQAAVAVRRADLITVVDAGLARITDWERRVISHRWAGRDETVDGDGTALIIALFQDYPPMSFIGPDGRPAGLLVDFWRLWSQTTGQAVRFRPSSWPETLEAMRRGEADLHSGLFRNRERERWLAFTDPLHAIRTVEIHRVGEPTLSLGARSGRRVAVLEGSFQADWLVRHWPTVTTVPFASAEPMVLALVRREIDAIINEAPTVQASLNGLGFGGLVERGDTLLTNQLFGAVRKADTALLSQVNRGLATLPRDALIAIDQRWLPDPEDRYYRPTGFYLTATERRWLRRHPRLRVAVLDSDPPLGRRSAEGRYVGLNADVMAVLADRLDTAFDPVFFETVGALRAAVLSGQVDAAFGVPQTFVQAGALLFTDTYAHDSTILVQRADDPPFDAWEALAGLTVTGLAESPEVAAVRQLIADVEVAPFQSEIEAVRRFATGTGDAHVTSLVRFGNGQRADGVPGLRVMPITRNTEHNALRIAVPRDRGILHGLLEKALDAIPRSDLVELGRRWLQVPVVERPASALETPVGPRTVEAGDGQIWSLLALLGLVSLLFVAVIAGVSWLLQRVFARNGAVAYHSQAVNLAGLGLVVAFLVTVIIAAWFVLGLLERRARIEAGQSLQTVLETTHRALRIWTDDRLATVGDLALRQRLHDLVIRLQLVGPASADLQASWEMEDVRDFFRDRPSGFGGDGFAIVASDGVVIASHRDGALGRVTSLLEQRPELLKRAFAGETLFIPPALVAEADGPAPRRQPVIHFAAPIPDATGETMAVLLLPVDTAEVFDPLMSLGRIGASGETYAFDARARLISESRFLDDLVAIGLIEPGESAALNILVHDPGRDLTATGGMAGDQSVLLPTRMAADALAGRDGSSTDGYRDYRGVSVLGAWRWDAALGIGLTTEIDEVEALASYRLVHNTVLLLLGATVLLGLGLTSVSVWIGRSATRALARANDALEQRVADRTRALAEKERHLRMALENMSDGMYVIDSNGAFILTNDRYVAMMDVPPGMVAPGCDVRGVIHLHAERGDYGAVALDEAVRLRFAALMSDEYVVREMVLGNGTRIVELRKAAIADGGAVVTISDITERKEAQYRLEDAEERARLLLFSVGEGVFGVDRDGRLGFVNPMALDILGYRSDELLERRIHAIVHHSRPDGTSYPLEECPMYKAYTFGTSGRTEDEVLWRKDGSPVEVEYHATPIYRRGDLVGAVIAFVDITERKQVERERNEALAVISSSIKYASRIQRAILPDQSIFAAALSDHFVVWEPRDVIGGDVYWCDVWGDGLLLILGDCTGHGVPGAFMTLLASGALARARMEITAGDMPELVRRVHQLLQITLGQHLEGGQSDDGMDLAACYIQAEADRLTFVGAALDLFVADQDGVTEIKGSRHGIGYRNISRDQAYAARHIPLFGDQCFYLTTDGIIDQVGGSKARMFGKRRFKAILEVARTLPMAEQGDHLRQALADYQGQQRRRDDISVIGFRV